MRHLGKALQTSYKRRGWSSSNFSTPNMNAVLSELRHFTKWGGNENCSMDPRGRGKTWWSRTNARCLAFEQHFARLFRTSDRRNNRADFNVYLNSLPRLSVIEAESCKRTITAMEVQEMVKRCMSNRLPGLNGLSYKLYISMPDLFGGLMADICCKWQQNGGIPTFACRGTVTLLRKDRNMVGRYREFHIHLCSMQNRKFWPRY